MDITSFSEQSSGHQHQQGFSLCIPTSMQVACMISGPSPVETLHYEEALGHLGQRVPRVAEFE